MIPKTIHYCWLSGDEFPELLQKCMNTWKEKLPDYEFVLWDTKKFDLESSLWAKQAFETKKYAFAADYIRLYAVYHYGGIYMDTDIEVIKSFDELLEYPYFIGSEGNEVIEAGIFGAEKGTPWLKDCLDYYTDRPFINEDGSINPLTLPRVMTAQIKEKRPIKTIHNPSEFNVEESRADKALFMYTEDYFCAKNHGTGVIQTSGNTFTIHHFAMSWISKKRTFLPNLKRKLMKIFGVGIISFFIKIFGLRKLKKKLKSQ